MALFPQISDGDSRPKCAQWDHACIGNRLMLADALSCHWLPAGGLAPSPPGPGCSALTMGDSRRCQWSAGADGPLKTLARAGLLGVMGSLGRWGAGLSPGTGRTDSPKTTTVGMLWGAAPVFSPANGPCSPVGRALESGIILRALFAKAGVER